MYAQSRTERTTRHPDSLPPVKTLLAALVWLVSRQRIQPDRNNLFAITHQLERLAIHPEAGSDDLRAGLRLAASVEIDLVHLMAACLESGQGALFKQ